MYVCCLLSGQVMLVKSCCCSTYTPMGFAECAVMLFGLATCCIQVTAVLIMGRGLSKRNPHTCARVPQSRFAFVLAPPTPPLLLPRLLLLRLLLLRLLLLLLLLLLVSMGGAMLWETGVW